MSPGGAPCGRVSPWWSAAAAVPASSPKKAPCPVARRQNMPSRKVANSGAFTNANTSWSMSMMLLNRVAAYAAATLSQDPEHRGGVAHPEVVPVGLAGLDVGLVDVVGPHRVERRHVARHARHERRHERGEPEPEQPGREVVGEQRRDRQVVVRRAVGADGQETAPRPWCSAMAIMPGRMTRAGKSILGRAAISGVRRAARHRSAAMARCTTRKSVHQ